VILGTLGNSSSSLSGSFLFAGLVAFFGLGNSSSSDSDSSFFAGLIFYFDDSSQYISDIFFLCSINRSATSISKLSTGNHFYHHNLNNGHTCHYLGSISFY
jgi:hypothetical protein